MVKDYWRKVHSRAFKETCTAVGLASRLQVMIRLLSALAILLALAFVGSADASRDELIVRAAIGGTIVLLFPFVYAWKLVSVPAYMDDEVQTKLGAAEASRPSGEMISNWPLGKAIEYVVKGSLWAGRQTARDLTYGIAADMRQKAFEGRLAIFGRRHEPRSMFGTFSGVEYKIEQGYWEYMDLDLWAIRSGDRSKPQTKRANHYRWERRDGPLYGRLRVNREQVLSLWPPEPQRGT